MIPIKKKITRAKDVAKKRRKVESTFSGALKSMYEKKFFDVAKTATTVANTGTILSSSIHLVDAGTGINQMLGRKIVITSINIKGRITLVSATNATLGSLLSADIFRIFITLDKQANGAATTVASMLNRS